ncbi:thiamine phosphate synthase [Entomobacter blattae]|uniref:Thiamine-phosphate synthase n=1 Tax=Entomobacter blattae TaxID=2762277 RepID=A0A7H1NTB4_9PROT|nr:thiamine phosphate synthase [Entomobacter blattae]QNT79024.1 Thiamine-phosphate synthase [Entomobacter blattae]
MQTSTQLYLITPVNLDLTTFPKLLEKILHALPIAAVQLCLTTEMQRNSPLSAIETLLPIVQNHGCAFLLRDHVELALKTGCDGLHLSHFDVEKIKTIRKKHDTFQIGVSCQNSRHLAMEAGEAGADYVSFREPSTPFSEGNKVHPPSSAFIELLSWWSDVMEIPAVAEGDISTENALDFVKTGVDFLAVQDKIWTHPEGALKALETIDNIIKNNTKNSPTDRPL